MLWFFPVKALPLVSWFAPVELSDIPEWTVGLCLLLALLEPLWYDPHPTHTAGLLRARLGGPLQDRRGVGLHSLGAWGSALDLCVRSSRALLSKSHQSTPQGSCSGQGLSTPRACPPGSMAGGEPCVDPGGQKACFGGRGAGPLLACPTSLGSPLPAPALGPSGAQATTQGRATGGPPRPSAVMAAWGSRPLQAQLGGLGPGGPPWVPTRGRDIDWRRECRPRQRQNQVLFASQAPWRDTRLRPKCAGPRSQDRQPCAAWPGHS